MGWAWVIICHGLSSLQIPRHKVERDGARRKVWWELATSLGTDVSFRFLPCFLGESSKLLSWMLAGTVANLKGISSLQCPVFFRVKVFNALVEGEACPRFTPRPHPRSSLV